MRIHLLLLSVLGSLVLVGCDKYYADRAAQRGIEAYNIAKDASSHGDQYTANAQYREAQLQFEVAAEKDPNNTESHYNLAVTCQSLKKYDRAISEYDRALECFPGNGKAHSGKIECLVEMGVPQARIDNAVAEATGRVKSSNRSSIYLNLAKAYYHVGRVNDIPPALERAVQMSPGDAYVQATAGRFYRAIGDIDSASKHFLKAYDLNHDEPGIAWDLGTVGIKLPPTSGR